MTKYPDTQSESIPITEFQSGKIVKIQDLGMNKDTKYGKT